MDTVAKVGGDVVDRYAGDADGLIEFLDVLAAEAGGDPLLLEFKALVEEVETLGEYFDFDFAFFAVGASGPATSGVTLYRFVLAGEQEVPPVSGDADAGDLFEAFIADSEVMNLTRVVGPDNTNVGNVAYIMTFGDIPATSGGDGSTDVMLVL